MFTSIEEYSINIALDVVDKGKAFEDDLTTEQNGAILFLLLSTNLSALTKRILTHQFFEHSIRADVLADIVLNLIAETGE